MINFLTTNNFQLDRNGTITFSIGLVFLNFENPEESYYQIFPSTLETENTLFWIEKDKPEFFARKHMIVSTPEYASFFVYSNKIDKNIKNIQKKYELEIASVEKKAYKKLEKIFNSQKTTQKR